MRRAFAEVLPVAVERDLLGDLNDSNRAGEFNEGAGIAIATPQPSRRLVVATGDDYAVAYLKLVSVHKSIIADADLGRSFRNANRDFVIEAARISLSNYSRRSLGGSAHFGCQT